MQANNGSTVGTEPTTNSTPSSSSNSSSNGQGIIGTYEFTDEINHTWVLKLNSDETATIQLKGSNSPAYGSWSDWREGNNRIYLDFSDQAPKVWFPAGEEDCYTLIIFDDGYIYRSNSDAKAKNPRKRLAITKVR